MLSVTTAVCTWNRSASLARTLEQMTGLVVPRDIGWELLIVNNCCTDGTDAVIASFADRLPVRRTFEPRPGLANARNRAVAEASGEYVVWTDDDVLVDSDWLAAYCRAFRRWPDADVFGGPIEPLFEGEPPEWIPRTMDRIGAVYGRQTLGTEPVALSADSVGAGPYGGNMAVRRDVQLRFPYDAGLGVSQERYSIGEETEAIRRILSAGSEGWWTPEPRVRHWVPRASQTEAYVRRWMVGCGRYIALSRDGSVPRTRAQVVRAYGRLIHNELAYRARRPFSSPEVWIRNLIQAGFARGSILAAAGHGDR
jgi:glycosyltransferase involved in cell wall biosynthesis